MNPYNFSILVFASSGITLALLVFIKRRDLIGKIYFFYFLFIMIWAIGFAVVIATGISYSAALFSTRFSNAAAAFIYAAWYHFCILFIGEGNKHRENLKRFFYVTAGLTALASYSPWFIPSMSPKAGFENYGNAGPIFYVHAGLFFAATTLGFAELVKKWQGSAGSVRKQLTGLVSASFFGYLGGFLIFLPVLNVNVPQYAIFLMPLYPYLFAYFMAKEQLLDTDEIVRLVHKEKLEAIGVLAASINHEIKSPVYVIKSLAESHLLAIKEKGIGNNEECLIRANATIEKVYKQAGRVADMVQRLSRFAKSGLEEKAKLEAVDVNQVLDNIIPLVQYDFLIHQVEIIREVPKDLPFIHGDIRYTEEILFNLLVNAGQAIKESGKEGKIHIRATATSVILNEAESRMKNLRSLPTGQAGFGRSSNSLRMTKSDKVQIVISDNGPGIPKDRLANIFKPFYTTKQEGSGLGLYITKQLVNRLQAQLAVTSELNNGTTFSLEFKKHESV